MRRGARINEAGLKDVLQKIERRVRNNKLVDYLVEKVTRYMKTKNERDDLTLQESGYVYGPYDYGQVLPLSKKRNLDIDWSNHAEYRSDLRDVPPEKMNQAIRDWIKERLQKQGPHSKKVRMKLPGQGTAVVDYDLKQKPADADVITVWGADMERCARIADKIAADFKSDKLKRAVMKAPSIYRLDTSGDSYIIGAFGAFGDKPLGLLSTRSKSEAMKHVKRFQQDERVAQVVVERPGKGAKAWSITESGQWKARTATALERVRKKLASDRVRNITAALLETIPREHKTLWYENEAGEKWYPDLKGGPLANAPDGFKYQHSRFPTMLRENMLKIVQADEVEACEHPEDSVQPTGGWVDGVEGRECKACGGTQMRNTGQPWPDKWEAYGSRSMGAMESGWSEDLALALVKEGFSLPNAIIVSATSCERCMNTLAHECGLEWGYKEGSEEWQKCGTECSFCKEGKVASTMRAGFELNPKKIKLEVWPYVVDEWVGLEVTMEGDWDGNEPGLKDRLLEIMFDHPDFKRGVSKWKGKRMEAPTSEDSPMTVSKRIPTPRSPRDFEDWDIWRGHARFSLSDR